MEISWADIVRQYHHDDRRAWADVVDDEDEGSLALPESKISPGIIFATSENSGEGNPALPERLSQKAGIIFATSENSGEGSPALPERLSLVAHKAASLGISDNPTKDVDGRSWAAVVGSSALPAEQARKIAPPVCFGDPVGIHAVQSILMSATQKSLSHFHTAGMSTIVSARLTPSPAEAMNADYSNTSMTFQSSDDVYNLRGQLVGAKISSFMTNVGSSLTGLDDRENVWYEAAGTKIYDGTVLRIYVDYNRMRDHGLTLKGMARAAFGSGTSTSPDFMGMIDINVPDDYMSQWLARTDSLVCGTLRIRSCDKIDDVNAITKGTDILAVSRVNNVTKKTITSNDVLKVEFHFGIEAAAAVLEELTGSHVVSDFMARTGKILPFVKSSVEVKQKGMLTSMGFEKPKEDIKKKCAPATSVYESIMTGVDPTTMYSVRATLA
jgi:hypothetical protein